jgi:hypothetical protein
LHFAFCLALPEREASSASDTDFKNGAVTLLKYKGEAEASPLSELAQNLSSCRFA